MNDIIKADKDSLMLNTKTVLGTAAGYIIGRPAFLLGLGLLIFTDEEISPIGGGMLVGGLIGGAETRTGDMKADAGQALKNLAKGGLNVLYLDKVAPELDTKLKANLGLAGMPYMHHFTPTQTIDITPAQQLQQMQTLKGTPADGHLNRIVQRARS